MQMAYKNYGQEENNLRRKTLNCQPTEPKSLSGSIHETEIIIYPLNYIRNHQFCTRITKFRPFCKVEVYNNARKTTTDMAKTVNCINHQKMSEKTSRKNKNNN